MNRKERRAAKVLTAEQEKRVTARAVRNADHWMEIKTIKRQYDSMTPEEQAEAKPTFAAAIDEHLAALKAI